MHPPRVSDAQVLGVIAELATRDALPSGAAVRTALAARFGSRGGVARIYRLLSQERHRRSPAPEPRSMQALQQELQALREKLARAEQREDEHQSRWAQEVDRWRRVADAEREAAALLRRQLQAAELRAAALERQLQPLRLR